MEDREKKIRRGMIGSRMNSLDDACLMHILTFLSPLPDRYNAARVCRRWRYLASDRRLWLNVKESEKSSSISRPGTFLTIEEAVISARPGDTISISSGLVHIACNIQINKPLCLVGGGTSPDETVVVCPRGFDSAFEFLAAAKITNLTIKAELGNCLMHRSGRLIIDKCVLQCDEHPLEHLCCPIVTTANMISHATPTSSGKKNSMSVTDTRIEGGASAVITKGDLALQEVRVIYAQAALFFWFNVSQKCLKEIELSCNV